MSVILHIIDTTGPGGAEDIFITLADKIRHHGYQSVVIIRGEGYVENNLRKVGLDPIIISAKGSFNFQLVRRIIAVTRQFNVSVIQSHLLGSNVYAAIVGILTKTPVVATYHGMVDVDPNERFKRLKRWVMRHGISRFITVSNALLDNIKTNKLLDETRTSTIYNGIDITRYNSVRKKRLREQYNISEETVVFGCLGNVRKAKRYDWLLDAANELNKSNVDVFFFVAGDIKKSLMVELQEIISVHNLSNIIFLGFSDDSAEFLSNLDAFLLTSESEGFSIATIEAMASSLPIVATKSGGPQEIIQNASQGTLVAAEPHGIAQGIEKIVSNIKNGGKLNNAGRQRVEDTFSVDVMVENYRKVYDGLQYS